MAAGIVTPFSRQTESSRRVQTFSDQPHSQAAAPPHYPDGRSRRPWASEGAWGWSWGGRRRISGIRYQSFRAKLEGQTGQKSRVQAASALRPYV